MSETFEQLCERLERELNRMRERAEECITELRDAKQKKEGVIVRPGDVVFTKQNTRRTVSNRKQYESLRGQWDSDSLHCIDEDFCPAHASYSYYTTLNGRPIVGFRDNDE